MKMRFRSSAKVNLTLDIVRLRDDGYHELRSVVHTVGLWDELEFEFGAVWGLCCNVRELEGDDNLCLRAARLYLQETGRITEEHSLHITLHKSIPAGAGLGGGSGNAAATLRAMQRYFNDEDESRLLQIAARLGADVPLFLRGGCTLMEGIGEKLTPLSPLSGWLLIAKPPEFGRTSGVFAAWDQAPVCSNATAKMLHAFSGEFSGEAKDNRTRLHRAAESLQNDLRGASSTCGALAEELENRIQASGALGATMTGSGSAVFGIFDDEARAQCAALKIQDGHDGLQLFVVSFCDAGIVNLPVKVA